MTHLRNYVVGRIDRHENLLRKAREQYQRTKDESWGARVAELAGIVNELKLILNKIDRQIEFNF